MRQLSFAIMCEGSFLQEWQARCIKALLKEPNIKLRLLIMEKRDPEPFIRRLSKLRIDRLLFTLYIKLLFRPQSHRPVDMMNEYSGVPVLHCAVTTKGRFSQYFDPSDIAEVKATNLDFILRFGFNIIRGEILQAAKFGVWSFHHDDPLIYRGGPPCFWEIYHRNPVTGAILQQLTEQLDGGIVLKKGNFKTCLYSYEKNINAIYLATALWPLDVCRNILSNNFITDEPLKTKAQLFYPPDNRKFIVFILKMGINKIAAFWRYLFFREIWNVGIVAGPIERFLNEAYRPQIQFLPQLKRGEFRADPFGYNQSGKKHILFERFDFKTKMGRIESWQSSNNIFSKEKFDLRVNGHQSYPYIFEEEGTVYCLPETNIHNKIFLFKLEDGNWKNEGAIMEGQLYIDPTLIRYQNKYWIFYTLADQNSDANLFISHATSIRGPWINHIGNPVKTDISSSRPAGNFFASNGALYRPAQNCSRTYGGSIVINKVSELNELIYKEEKITEIFPWDTEYNLGIHTISNIGNDILIDAKKQIVRLNFFDR